MAGHSKWANIRRRKEAQDARKGKVFGKLIKEISVAARLGGADPTANARLRMAMQQARAANLPKDTMMRAIKKASTMDRNAFSTPAYEGYGPGGVAIYVTCLTDNIKRTIANVRHLFHKYQGNMCTKGDLDFIFDTKGVFMVSAPPNEAAYEALCLTCIDAGADEVERTPEGVFMTCPFERFGALQKTLEEADDFNLEMAEIQKIPLTHAQPNPQEAQMNLKLIKALEEDEDVERVFSNLTMEHDQN